MAKSSTTPKKQGKTSPPTGESPAKPGDQLGAGDRRIDLASLLSSATTFMVFDIWIIGLSPLIVHAWSHKAKLEMLTKQVKAVKGAGRAQRNPDQDFIDSLYEMPPDHLGRKTYGFPATGLKKSILAVAHKDKGLARSAVQSSLWINAEMVRVKTAFVGAICDLPLVRVYGPDPVMREDMVKIGSGLNKTASLAYRGQFSTWAINLKGRFNTANMSGNNLAFLIEEAGLACGLGEWRNEKSGVFGGFVMANAEQEAAWNAYAAGKGPLPVSDLAMAAE
jgi:hypothetical protein